MRLRPDQIPGQVQKTLAPLYLLSGDEPLQLGEAGDAIRQAARRQGFAERIVLHADAGFDWSSLAEHANALSLFADKKLIELRLPSGKPGAEGSKALQAYADAAPSDTVLVIIAGKVDKQAQQTKWFQALERAGVVVQVWPVGPERLADWVERRLQAKGMQPTREAAALIAERVEGNLLAAAQEIDKLLLLRGPGPLDAAAVLEAVADSARFDVYALADAALQGAAPRVARILEGLRAEGTEPLLGCWALTRDIRLLGQMSVELAGGDALEQVLGRHKVWDTRKPLVQMALRRHNSRVWLQLLRRAGRLDRLCKGQGVGEPWDELLQLALLIAGVRLFKVKGQV